MSLDIFLDTANLDEIEQILPWGIISGLTTNQKIFLAEKGCNFGDQIKQILSLINGPVSIEVTTNQVDGIIKEAREYATWGENVVIKVPMLGDGGGLRAVSLLEKEGIKTNATILMSSNQVLLAAKAGATYASLFFRRIKDYGDDPERVIRESRAIIDSGGFRTKVIVGSIRDPEDVNRAALSGAHIVTIPYKILIQMPRHPKTEETIKEFDLAWQEFKRAETRGN
jgi:transaldolase